MNEMNEGDQGMGQNAGQINFGSMNIEQNSQIGNISGGASHGIFKLIKTGLNPINVLKAIFAKWYYLMVGFSMLTLYNAVDAIGMDRINNVYEFMTDNLEGIAEAGKCFRYIEDWPMLYKCIKAT